MIINIADRHERQGIVHTLKEGRYGLRWGYASRIKKHNLLPCTRSYRRMVEQLEAASVSFTPCGICCNWDVSTEGNRATRNDKTPPNYPKKKLKDSIHPHKRDCPENVIVYP